MQQGRPQRRGPSGANRQGRGRSGSDDSKAKRPEADSARPPSHHGNQGHRSGSGRSSQNRQQQNQQQKNQQPQKTKKLGLFDLKSQATETVDIPTSNRTFKGAPNQNGDTLENNLMTRNVLFFETYAEAETALGQIQEAQKPGEELSLVVHQEHAMEGTSLNSYGRLFCGEAWWIIHHRRVQEGWYANAKS